MNGKEDLTLDELRERAPTLARVVSNVGTWEEHLNAMAELNRLLHEAAARSTHTPHHAPFPSGDARRT